MKRPGKVITNSTLAICGSSLLFASCDGYFVDTDMIDEAQLPDIGNSAICIELSQEDQTYLTFLNKLGMEIIENPAIAQEFAKNPQKYIEKYGYTQNINLDESMLHYVLTLGDSDINNAVRNNDIELVIKLMRKKGLLTNNFTKIRLSSEQLDQINHYYGFNKMKIKTRSNSGNDELVSAALVAIAWLFFIAIEDAIAGYNLGVGINVYAYANLKTKVNAWGAMALDVDSIVGKMALEENLSFKAITLKNPQKDTYILADKYIEMVSKDIVNSLENEAPDILQGLSNDELQQIIKYNMYCKMNN